jgi:hypothetical protein
MCQGDEVAHQDNDDQVLSDERQRTCGWLQSPATLTDGVTAVVHRPRGTFNLLKGGRLAREDVRALGESVSTRLHLSDPPRSSCDAERPTGCAAPPRGPQTEAGGARSPRVTHVGRFSSAHRCVFSETPSTTTGRVWGATIAARQAPSCAEWPGLCAHRLVYVTSERVDS